MSICQAQTTGTITQSLADLYSPIHEDLAIVEQIFDDELSGDLPFVQELCDTVRSYRGKMLRPSLLLLVAKATGGIRPAHHTLAAVIELVHMATLVHDDVLDEADERRKQPTINTIAGNEAAVLLGDYLISHAYHLCSSMNSQEASRRIGATTNRVCEGELLQNHHRENLQLTEAEYIEIIGRKTAALTATACALGAFFSAAEPNIVTAMQQYGLSAGIAFQIIDDVLDIVGDPGQVGKTLGLDVIHGKPTLPTIHALAHANKNTIRDIRDVLSGKQAGHRDALGTLLAETGSIDYAVTKAQHYVTDALKQLELLSPSTARTSLTALAKYIVRRRS